MCDDPIPTVLPYKYRCALPEWEYTLCTTDPVQGINFYTTVVSRVSAHGCLNLTCDFGPHGALTRDTTLGAATVYIDSLKCGTWALIQEWAFARDTMVVS